MATKSAAAQAVVEEGIEVPASAVGEQPQFASEDRERHQSKLSRTMEALKAQRKVAVKVQEPTWVQINGYTFQLQKNVRVEVPEQVAEILEEAGRI